MDIIPKSGRLVPLIRTLRVPAIFLLAASLLVFSSVQFARRELVVSVDGHTQVVRTFSGSVGGVLTELGITVDEADKLSHRLDDAVENGMVIDIRKAVPVYVRADGQEFSLRLAEATVRDAIERLGIVLEPLDRVEPALEQMLSAGDTVDVIRVTRQLLTQRTEMPYREIRRGNAKLDRGESRTLQRGIAGLREDTVEITLENGQEVTTRIIQSTMLRIKQDRVVEYGENTILSRGGRTMRFDRVFHMAATAYCAGTEWSGCPIDDRGRSACTGKYSDGITASGVAAIAGNGGESNPHIVAVDPRVIPLGSRLYIDGYGYAVAADTGSAIKGNKIDLLLNTHQAAWNFGRRKMRVYLLP